MAYQKKSITLPSFTLAQVEFLYELSHREGKPKTKAEIVAGCVDLVWGIYIHDNDPAKEDIDQELGFAPPLSEGTKNEEND